MFGRKRDADARGDIDFIALNIEGLRDDIDDTIGKRAGRFTLVIVTVLDDGKFVAAQARQHIGLPQRCLQANGRFAQQRITNRMAKRIVDMFEAIEIQQQDRE